MGTLIIQVYKGSPALLHSPESHTPVAALPRGKYVRVASWKRVKNGRQCAEDSSVGDLLGTLIKAVPKEFPGVLQLSCTPPGHISPWQPFPVRVTPWKWVKNGRQGA